MTYTLGTAAKATGLSKATIHRAIKSGRISATRHEDGSYTIQPVELHRVFDPVPAKTTETGSTERGMRRSATPDETGETPAVTPSPSNEIAIRNAQLEAELAGLKELLKVHRDQVEDLRGERDRLLGQVEAVHRLLTHQPAAPATVERPRVWFGWWRRSA